MTDAFDWPDPAAILTERGVTPPPGLPPEVLLELARIAALVWQDGRVVRHDEFHIDPADEGLLFGRGVWESTRTLDGKPWLWPQHLHRLRRTADQLDMPVAAERLPTSEQVRDFVRSLTTQDVLVRVNATAGPPGRPGAVWMTASLPPLPKPSIRLQSLRTPVIQGQPYLAAKTFHYANRLHVGRQAVKAGFDSSLMIDPEGRLLEAAHANLFVRLADGWATPAAAGGLFLPGTVRHYLLQNSPLPIRERVIALGELDAIQEAFVTNSNIGIVPVSQIDDRSFAVGRDTIMLKHWLTTQ